MAAVADNLSYEQTSRLRALIIPREHGAWGMLLVPLATGAIVAARSQVNTAALTLFAVAALSLFWLRTPLESFLGTSAIKAQPGKERNFALQAAIGIGLLALTTVAALLRNGQRNGLLVIAAVAVAAFATQALLKKLGRKGRMPAQVIGAVGLTSTAAAAYYVATGRFDQVALGLWLANLLFAGDQIHFVQLRIRASRAATMGERLLRGFPFFFGQFVMIGAIVAACRVNLFPAALWLAFVPVLLRGMWWFARERRPLDVHRLGFTELAHALVFAGVATAVFLLM